MEAFRKNGEFWTLEFDGTVVYMRDLTGLRYLARLLASPGQAHAAHDLMRAVGRTGACEQEPSVVPPTSGPQNGATTSLDTALEAERARSAVTKRIKDAIRKIHACHPVLGRHLMRTVSTGYVCVYHADPDRPTHWVLS